MEKFQRSKSIGHQFEKGQVGRAKKSNIFVRILWTVRFGVRFGVRWVGRTVDMFEVAVKGENVKGEKVAVEAVIFFFTCSR